ncbi:hypothetical protein [Methanoculleus sp.]|uniref:hypothetical protein n=1 Tax=Methanoculleus sp. TaxID=90427 RepID=UPI0026106953|nr:hypothetical protein [Methanoculleus sp.]MDI6867749.1 hypothetical protein [Methanoculleus sp.]
MQGERERDVPEGCTPGHRIYGESPSRGGADGEGDGTSPSPVSTCHRELSHTPPHPARPSALRPGSAHPARKKAPPPPLPHLPHLHPRAPLSRHIQGGAGKDDIERNPPHFIAGKGQSPRPAVDEEPSPGRRIMRSR